MHPPPPGSFLTLLGFLRHSMLLTFFLVLDAFSFTDSCNAVLSCVDSCHSFSLSPLSFDSFSKLHNIYVMQALSLNSFLLYLLRLSMMFPDSGEEVFSGSFSPQLVDLSRPCGLLTLKLSIFQRIVVTEVIKQVTSYRGSK